MIVGRIEKTDTPDDHGVILWSAECRVVGAHTQGKSREDAIAMLTECIELLIDHEGFAVRVTPDRVIGPDAFDVIVDANLPELLIAAMVRHERIMHHLRISEAAERFGASRESYEAIERGERTLSIAELDKLLEIVAPELVVTIAPRIAS